MQNEIRGINIKQVIWKIIFGWKKVFLLGVVCSLLLVSYKYMKDTASYNAQKNMGSTISEGEIKKLEDIISKYARLNYLEEYYNDSLVMQLNPKEYNVLEVQYYIDSDYTFNFENDNEKDYTSSVVSAYGTYVTSGYYSEMLKKELDIQASIQSVKELIQVVEDKEGATVKITVSIPNGCDATKLEMAIDKIMNAKKEELEKIGKHNLVKLNSAVAVAYSDILEKKIYDVSSNIAIARSNVEASKSTLTDAQKKYLHENLSYENYRGEFAIGIAVVGEPSVNVKFAIVGFILGIFASCAIYLLREVFSNKVQNADDIELVYGIRNIGTLDDKDSEKKKMFIDRMLYNIKNSNEKLMTKSEKVEYVVSNIEIICNKNSISSISLIKNVGKKEELAEVMDVVTALEKKGIKCKVLDNITGNAEQLKNVVSDGNVVIIGKTNKTSYAKLEQEIRLLKQHEINILGSVIID